MISLGASAQAKNYRYGIKFGPAFDWASSGSTATENMGVRLGFNAGLVVDRHFSEQIAFSSGLDFHFMRMKYQFTDLRMVDNFLEEVQLPVERRVRATEIEVPLKLKAGFHVAESVKAYVEAGCGVAFNLNDRVKDAYDYYYISYRDEVYVVRSEQYRLLQASLLFGVGAEYEINRKLSFFAQAAFNHSLSNAFVRALEKQTGSIIRNNFIGVEVGMLF